MRLSPRFLLSLATGGMLLALPDLAFIVHAETPSPPPAPVAQPRQTPQEAPEAPKAQPAPPETPAAKPSEGPAPLKPAEAKAAEPRPAPSMTGEPRSAAQANPASVLPGPPRPAEDAIIPTAEELEFLELCNKERVARGLNRLTLDLTLIKVAREHSAEMRDKSYFNHESPTEGRKTPLDRYLRAVAHRPSYACVGENLFWATVIDVKRGHKAFMDSPTHRENILFPRYERMGVGIVKRNGEFWVTEMFVTNTDPVSVARNRR